MGSGRVGEVGGWGVDGGGGPLPPSHLVGVQGINVFGFFVFGFLTIK